MPSTFFGIEIAKRGIIASNLAQNVISHNIANANTPAYSRQRIELSTTPPFPYPTHNREIIKGLIGTGVAVESIISYRDKILENKINESINYANYYKTISEKLNELESILNEPYNLNLNSVLNEFFKSVNDVANNPENMALRRNLINNSTHLVNEFKYFMERFEKVNQFLNDNVKNIVSNINSLAENIKEINLEIFKSINLGYNPNDLIDKRNYYVNELSKYVNFQSTELKGNILKIEINGHILVGENYTMKITNIIDVNGNLKPIFEDGKEVVLNNGDLKAIIDVRDTFLPKYQSYINEIATSLITNVNKIHQSGYGLNSGVVNNINFFNGNDANDIDVNPLIKADVSLFAAAKQPFSPGDGTNAFDINKLKDSFICDNNTSTLYQKYEAFISHIASDVKIAEESESLYENLKSNLQTKKEKLSGVSLDEEMTELIKYQHAFVANVKVLQVQDEILDKLINLIR